MKSAPETAAAGGSARLFIALWPAAATRSALAAWCPPLGGGVDTRRVPPAQLHLTLHFLGQVPHVRIPELCRILRTPVAAHELRFSRCECWRGGLLVAVPDDVPPALTELHAALGTVLRGLGLPTEARALRPHVTLARRFSGPLPPARARPLRWPVRRCVLVESRAGAGGGYTVLCRAPGASARPAADAAPPPVDRAQAGPGARP